MCILNLTDWFDSRKAAVSPARPDPMTATLISRGDVSSGTGSRWVTMADNLRVGGQVGRGVEWWVSVSGVIWVTTVPGMIRRNEVVMDEGRRRAT